VVAGLAELVEQLPDGVVDDLERLDLLALREDRQLARLGLEVVEPDAAQRAFADPEEQQQPERDLVARRLVRREDLDDFAVGERAPMDRPRLRRLDRLRGVAADGGTVGVPPEEADEDRQPLVVGPRREQAVAFGEVLLDHR
jgi:hypothetical protein